MNGCHRNLIDTNSKLKQSGLWGPHHTRSPVLFQPRLPEKALSTVHALVGEHFQVDALLVNCQVAFTAEYLSTPDLTAGHMLELIFYQPPMKYLANIILVGTKVQD